MNVGDRAKMAVAVRMPKPGICIRARITVTRRGGECLNLGIKGVMTLSLGALKRMNTQWR
jgi:hypothetical protein